GQDVIVRGSVFGLGSPDGIQPDGNLPTCWNVEVQEAGLLLTADHIEVGGGSAIVKRSGVEPGGSRVFDGRFARFGESAFPGVVIRVLESDRGTGGVDAMEIPNFAAVRLERVVAGRPVGRLELDEVRPGFEPHGDLDPGVVSDRLDGVANLS